jgi:hypothetical protein
MTASFSTAKIPAQAHRTSSALNPQKSFLLKAKRNS